ncbi:hypothetical protein FRC01_003155 [Tulasnella sp. 417]|nr:hypothetical protein FRC01_003155 [Tulasnella sp. 417]
MDSDVLVRSAESLHVASWIIMLSDPPLQQATLDELSHLVVPPSQLAFENDAELGCGGYGEVYLAHLTKSSETPPEKVAVKQLRIVHSKEVRRRIAIRLAREVKVWAAAKHPNILELVGFYLSENYECAQLISAYIAHGNVKDYIKTCNPGLEIRLNLVKGLTSGINYLHTCDPPICHGDLKPSNLLVSDSIEAVLCDFGLATFIDESGASSGLTTSKSVKGSTRYMSPELLLETGVKHTLGSDMWAWACTVLEVLTDREPFHTMKGDAGVITSLVLGQPPGSVDLLDDLSSEVDATCHRTLDVFKCTIPGCWVSDFAKRPPSSKIITQLFFQRDAKTSAAGSAPGQPLLIEPMDEAGLVPTNTGREHGKYQSNGHGVPLPFEASLSNISAKIEQTADRLCPCIRVDSIQIPTTEGYGLLRFPPVFMHPRVTGLPSTSLRSTRCTLIKSIQIPPTEGYRSPPLFLHLRVTRITGTSVRTTGGA